MARNENGRSRRPRGSLSEEEIIAAAIMIVERDGLEGLSMPLLAKHLDAGVMSIYWYFRNKDDLLLAMADRAFQEAYPDVSAVGSGPWDEELVRVFVEFYKGIQRAPLFLRLCRANRKLLMLRPSIVPVVAKRFEAELRLLFEGLGLGVAEAMRLHSILTSYTLGFALMQQALSQDGGDATPEAAIEQAVAQLDPARYPALTGAPHIGSLVALDDAAYEAGLQLLVAGMKPAVERV
jgi:AcrR family transcriptional regulator